MMKAIVSFVFLLFSVSAYAKGIIHLKDFNILHVSDNVDNLIFTFDRIEKYRFIKLSDDYWYIASPGNIISINTPLIPKGSIRRILVRIIKGESRIFFKMDSGFSYRFRIVMSRNHHFLVVRIEKNRKSKSPEVVKLRQVRSTVRPVVVIDPGHGGKDPGALGLFGLKEKNITLPIGKYVAEFLRHDGYKVVMTRTSDTYPTLADRVKLSNKVKASVFVSIHTNYAPRDSSKTHGVEVYFVNTTSDKKALRLAARENGMSLAQVSDLNRIIISLIQTTKIKYSKLLALYVYKYVLKYGKMVYKGYIGRGVRQAPFYVLVGTHCPSILVETAFINNRQDALHLKSDRFRKAVARGIARGIEVFLNNYGKLISAPSDTSPKS